MAGTYDIDKEMGYQATKMYKEASPERRRQINRYKKELGISDDHMFLLMFQKDLEMVPESEQNSGDYASYGMLVVAFLLLWGTLQSAMGSDPVNVPLIFIGLASFGLVAFIFYRGILNPYKRTVSNVNKQLKEFPEVQDFDSWDLENPGKTDRKAIKNKGKNRR